MSFLSFSSTLNTGEGLRNDRLICHALLHTLYQNETLAAKSFEKIDKNAKCHSLLLSPTLNSS